MSITTEEKDELLRLEAAFDEAGGRGIEMAERIDHLRMKASRPTVGDFIRQVMASMTPDQAEDTFIFENEDDVDVPCEFFTFRGFIEDWYDQNDPENT